MRPLDGGPEQSPPLKNDQERKKFKYWPEQLTTKDVMECLGFSYNQAYVLFNQPDFPQSKPVCRRNRKVGKYALREYLNGRKIDD